MNQHTQSSPAPLAITLGDAAGIGPEIVVKMHMQGLPAAAIVYGDLPAIERAAKLLDAKLKIIALDRIESNAIKYETKGVLYIRPTSPALPIDLPYGKVNASAGRASVDALCMAIDDAMQHRISAIVTAPLNKEAMHAAGIDYPGHTEILAERSGTQHVAMMLVNEQLKVILATIHIALADVPRTLTKELELRTIELAHHACLGMGITKPRIAVAGLNPHAGENGKFGQEEQITISPAIAMSQSRGFNASGPWPGDTIFMRARRGEFDIVVAQYHDQGLIPIKYLGIDEGVNVTVGLPFVRTSVDHGTAFDIAGKGIADPSSLLTAFETALKMLGRIKPHST